MEKQLKTYKEEIPPNIDEIIRLSRDKVNYKLTLRSKA
jgi:hypothetical protein